MNATASPAGPSSLPPALPAATVIIAREVPTDSTGGLEVLLLKRSAVGAFANMWVFPGGRVDDTDNGDDELSRARSAAVREAYEEVALSVDPADLVTLSHWTPPSIAPKRYETWFFVAPWSGESPVIDAHEIVEARWISPADAMRELLEVAPPTHVTLATLAEANTIATLRDVIESRGVERFVTVPAQLDGSLVLLWEPDAGYESADATMAGPRHRMLMRDGHPMIYQRD